MPPGIRVQAEDDRTNSRDGQGNPQGFGGLMVCDGLISLTEEGVVNDGKEEGEV
jgi:hypothetical protein